MQELMPVTVGSGRKIHAGYVAAERTEIIARQPVVRRQYASLCGSDTCTTGWRRPRAIVRPLVYAELEQVNCAHCRQLMESRHAES